MRSILFTAVVLVAVVAGAQATPLLSDAQVDIIRGEGQRGTTGRYDPTRLFDGITDRDNFYSLGLGGSVEILLDDPLFFTDEATFIEVTWNNTGSYHEAAEIYWGIDSELEEDAFGLLANCPVDNYDGRILEYEEEVVNDNNIMTWKIDAPTDPRYNTLLIKDVTRAIFPESNRSYDGFDIGEISYATAVPEPASVTLLGLGMISLFGLSFRRKK